MTPDEKRPKQAQDVVKKYLDPQVAALCFLCRAVTSSCLDPKSRV